MKKFAWVLVTALALLAVSVAPVLADDLPEAGTAAPGVFTNVSGGVGGKGALPAAPPLGSVALSKSGSKWIDHYVTQLTYKNYIVLPNGDWWPPLPWSWVEQSVTRAGAPQTIQFQRLGNYACAVGFGCSPWNKAWAWGVDGLSFWGWGYPPIPATGLGVKSISRHTFGWLYQNKAKQYDVYLVLNGWLSP